MDDRNATIRESIECCRPGSDDLAAPEMAVLAEAVGADAEIRARLERIQEYDRRLTRSFHDVAVPEGLEDRLLARLAWDDDPESRDRAVSTGMAEIVDTATDHVGESLPDSLPDSEKPDNVAPASSRRRRLPFAMTASAVLVLAAGIGVTLYMIGASNSPIPRDDFLGHAKAAISIALQQGDWNTDPSTAPAPADCEFPRDKIRREPIGWTRTPAPPLDDQAAAYLLSDRIGSEVILLVIRSKQTVDGLQPDPPRESFPESGEQSIGAWRSDGHLYVVLVRGPNHGSRYRAMLEDPPTLASTPRKVSPPSLIGKL